MVIPCPEVRRPGLHFTRIPRIPRFPGGRRSVVAERAGIGVESETFCRSFLTRVPTAATKRRPPAIRQRLRDSLRSGSLQQKCSSDKIRVKSRTRRRLVAQTMARDVAGSRGCLSKAAPGRRTPKRALPVVLILTLCSDCCSWPVLAPPLGLPRIQT